MTDLANILESGELYGAYAYSYPHKTAYRHIAPTIPLEDVWAGENKQALFGYVHIPFCEMRCGFCNLFTMAKPKGTLAEQFVGALRRQAESTANALGDDARFARFAIGGGTPTQLDTQSLYEVFRIAKEILHIDLHKIPVACEVSPETIEDDKIALLKEQGVNRVSIGVQSFLTSETKSIRRPQPPEVLHQALTKIHEADFDTFNIDLIYGLPNQTEESWRHSIEEALRYDPEEIFLYPLYVRPLTGLGNSSKSWDDQRVALYRYGRDFLKAQGFTQMSMRMFRRTSAEHTPGPVYRCQEDGMVGIGVGARSYTKNLHYSSEYAVGRRGVVAIIEDYVQRDATDFDVVQYGFALDREEQRRRYVTLSLLSHEGLSKSAYRHRFDSDPFVDLPQLEELLSLQLADWSEDVLHLTDAGVEASDVLGPWLHSSAVKALMEEYEAS